MINGNDSGTGSMRERIKTKANTDDEASLRRLASDYGYRLERHKKIPNRWYIVEHGPSLSILAQHLTLSEAGEHLLILGPAGAQA